MKIAVIVVYAFSVLLSLLYKYLNYRNRHAPLPENVRDVYDEAEFEKSKAYGAASLRLAMVSDLVSGLVLVGILAFNVHSRVFDFIVGYTDNSYFQFILMFMIVGCIGFFVKAVLDGVKTFRVEAKYGFNKTKPITFVGDLLKEGLGTAVLTLGLLSAFVTIYGVFGDWVFFMFFAVLVVVVFLIMLLYPLIMRLFYKFTPLEDGPFRDRLENLAKTVGFPIKGIFVLNASKRTTKSNAFFSGFGRTKTIGLYDNLFEQFTEDEILSVVAHEIGHGKERHGLSTGLLFLLNVTIIVATAYFVIQAGTAPGAFGFYGTNVAFSMYVAFMLAMPSFSFMQVPSSMLSRKNEYEADTYSVKYAGKEAAMSAMKKLYVASYGNLTPHPLVVKLTYSHPPLSERLMGMEKQA